MFIFRARSKYLFSERIILKNIYYLVFFFHLRLMLLLKRIRFTRRLIIISFQTSICLLIFFKVLSLKLFISLKF